MDPASAERAAPTGLEAALIAEIAAKGPMPVSRYMGLANAQYYAAGDPLGAAGDFVTAPEISQMFGEMIGLWLADLWSRAGRPAAAYVELGPGRGTLAADARRAMRSAGLEPPIHLVETSPVLRASQALLLPDAHVHDALATLPRDRPLLVVANEFFDALPVRQFVRSVTGWHERMVDHGPDGFTPVPGRANWDHAVPAHIVAADPGAIWESCPQAEAVAADLARRIAAQGGAALIVDYGYVGYAAGDTLQAVHAHAYADPFDRPGRSDLTAHVDFTALADAARGVRVWGPVAQGDFLTAIGLGARAARLAQAQPARTGEIEAARRRLVDGEEMGQLFKVLALTAPGWPEPEGFR